MLCPACAGGHPDLSAVSEETFARIEADGDWEGIRGHPEVPCEASGLRFVEEDPVDLDELRSRDVRAIAALGIHWVVVTVTGDILELDTTTPATRRFGSVTGSVALDGRIELVASPDGSMVAVTESLGLRGVVVDCATGRILLELARGEHGHKVTPFIPAFVERDVGGVKRQLLVHPTEWNRLDVTDPRSGEAFARRPIPPCSTPPAQHYLDYFHGALVVSPAGKWIADDGWHWHPFGALTTWSVDRWLAENPWESEDGETLRTLAFRGYFWDSSACWLNETTLAIWGHGLDDEWLIPAVQTFDVLTGAEKAWFPCFAGADDPHPTPWVRSRWMIFDRWLFVVRRGQGTTVWDTTTGACLLNDARVSPHAYQPATRTFIRLNECDAFVLFRCVEA